MAAKKRGASKIPMPRVTYPLKSGSKGKAIGALQSALTFLMDLDVKLFDLEKGIFGSKTGEALKTFRATYGLQSSGDFGPSDAEFLNGLIRDRELESSLTKQTESLTDMSSQIGKEKDVGTTGSLHGKLNVQVGKLDNMDTKLGEHSTKLSSVDTKLGDQGSKLGSIEKRLGEHTTELGKQTSKLGAIEAGLAGLGDTGKYQRLVRGQVRVETGDPFPGCVVRAFHIIDQGQGKARLGEDRTDAEGAYTIRYGMVPGEKFIQLAVIAVDERGKALCEPALIQQAKPLETVDLIVPGIDINPYRVVGKVGSRITAAIGGLRVVIVDKGLGGDVTLGEASTDDDGAYQATFSDRELRRRGKAQPDLQARVFAGNVFLGASDVHYNASQNETLNMLLGDKAASALQSEHKILTDALSKHFAGKLGDLKETDEQQDITYLANKTGWDARAVALAALADQFSARTADAAGARTIPQAFFYALFRAGLPANEETLYHTDAKTLGGVWMKAAEQGVISKGSTNRIPELIKKFQAVSVQKLLNGPALFGTSSLEEMLKVSGLDTAQQMQFAELYATHRTDMVKFWEAVSNTMGEKTARLQVDGKLGYLTINNAPLMQKVHEKCGPNGLSDPLQLAQMGYHQAEPWNQLLTSEVPLPKEIPGESLETQRANFAKYLGAQIRLAYPTAAVAQMVQSGELPLTGGAQGVSDQVHAFLTQHQGKLEIGVHPVEQYLAENKLQVDGGIVHQVKRLQRVYQITPSDQAMIGLMKRRVDSAYQIARYDKDIFVQSFAADLGGADQAALTHDRSVQVHNVVLNIALSYLTARTSPPIGVHSPPSVLDPAPAHAGDVIAYATLESLFGSMDFCACDHCRSILSPAAYLVDLLLFLQSDADMWTDFLKTWKENHANAPYPFADQNAWQKFQTDWNAQHPGVPLPTTDVSPFEVLMSRRPDIQHLPLSCENTNTALPYIDVVNETLEYYIANGLTLKKNTLDEYNGYDTNDVSSEDLLASPQFVTDSAYTTLRNEHFPAPLPFHQPLENLRRYFQKFDVALPLAMERLCKTQNLERGANRYGWCDIWMEEVGFSRAEYEILTDTTAVPLSRMYGFPQGTSEPDVISGLSNAKQFARRVGITYEDLLSVLRTRFINPHSDLIPKLERLGVNFVMLAELKIKNDALTDAKFDALLAKLAVQPDPKEYDRGIKGWVKNDANYSRIMSLITLAVPATPWTASKAYAIGDCVLPPVAPSEGTLYYECTASGTSTAVEPNWPVVPGNTYKNDGTVDWICRDASSCLRFDNLAFRYTDPTKLTQSIGAEDFIRLLRFLRLWKKLGWTIEQTDAALIALYPSKPRGTSEIEKLNNGFLAMLPHLGMVKRVLKMLSLTVKRDLLPFLACFAPIGIHDGAEWFIDKDQSRRLQRVPSLYRQLFLNPTLLEQDAVFADNGYGEFLTDTTKQLADHAEALRSAFNLTGDEFALIVADLPVNPTLIDRNQNNELELTLRNISAIFRRGWLARKLKLSVRELLLWIQLTGLDPFTAPDPTRSSMLRLIQLIQSMEDRSFKSAVALFLIWNHDLSGKSAPDSVQITELARSLRNDFSSIADQFAVTEDPQGDVARARVTLVYGQETSDAFFGILDDRLLLDVPYTQSAPTLEATITAADPRIAYDHFRHRLSHRGLVTTAMQTTLKNLGGVSEDFKKAVDGLFGRGEDVRDSFFARNPELKAVSDKVTDLDQTLKVDVEYTHTGPALEAAITAGDNCVAYDDLSHRLSYSGILTVARRDILKSIPSIPLGFQSAIDALFVLSQKSRGAVVLTNLQPELSRKRKRQQAVQRLSVAAGVDLVFTHTLLDPAITPYPLHAAEDPNKPALDDVLALETPGLEAKFFFRPTATGNVNLRVPAAANLAYAAGGSNPLPHPGNAISGIWSGQIETPDAGFYNFIIEADSGTTVALTLDGQARALKQNGNVWRNTDSIELKAGVLYEIELKIENIKEVLRIKWETPKRAREVIRSRYLYPPTILEPFSSTYVRFLKAASLSIGLGMTANELAYLATHSDYQVNSDGWLNALAVRGNPATAIAFLEPFEALLDFARIKSRISLNGESLLAVLKDPAAGTQNTDSQLFTITRWNPTALNDLLAEFGANVAGLGNFNLFRRVDLVFAIVQKMGIPVKALIQATSNDPTPEMVRDLQAALRARYDEASWREVVRPINDEMRSLQRDALVAYILHQMRSSPESAHINTPNKLFEYFLMDVQMDPCMLTSRIRHALSSVQLFIERCLMNLEPRVSPAVLNDKQWEWMKRYRVWEANRKVFLFPENWLEPELRDDKSPFFKEIENELLQGDITEERATTALLNYLSKLKEVEKLEPCGIFHVPRDDSKRTPEINHVVARTTGANRKYYYRRQVGRYWTPWEQIKLDIEDNPVIPVVWNDRLFLFWLRILKNSPLDPQKLPTSDSSDSLSSITMRTLTENMTTSVSQSFKISVEAVLCWNEYYNGKWQPTRTSDTNKPLKIDDFWLKDFDRSQLKLSALFSMEDGLRIIVSYGYVGKTEPSLPSFFLHSSLGTPEPNEKQEHDFSPERNFETCNGFTIHYPISGVPKSVLTPTIKGRAVQPNHSYEGDSWEAPFFYEDARHVFYVTTSEALVLVPYGDAFGVYTVPTPHQVTPDIPPLVLEPSEVVPDPGGPIIKQPGFGVTDPSPVERYISEDAYIHRAIGTPGSVSYGNTEIGLAGSKIKSIRTR